MTKIFEQSVGERSKWRLQADIAAHKLKGEVLSTVKLEMKVGIAFDDALLTLDVDVATIRTMPTPQLSSRLFHQICEAVDEHRARTMASIPK